MVNLKTIEGFIGTIAGIIILSAIIALVLSNIGDSIGDTDEFTVYNETLTSTSNGTNVTLAATSLTNLTGILVSNATAQGALIESGNWTVIETAPLDDENLRSFTFQFNQAENFWEGANMNITYTGSSFNTEGNVIRNGTETIANVTENLPIAGLVLGFGFILVVLFAALRVIRGNEQRGGGEF